MATHPLERLNTPPWASPWALPAAEGLTVELLGGFSVRHDGASAPMPSSTWRLIALLALERRPWSRIRACDVLWPDIDESRAQGNLRTVLWRVRQRGLHLVEVTPGGICLAAAVRVDVDEFATMARRLDGDGLAQDGLDAIPYDVLATLDPAPLCAELLPGWSEEFVDLHRERCRQLGLHAMESLARRLLSSGYPGPAMLPALTAVHRAPLRESAHRVVIEIHLAEGNHAEARRQFDRCAHALWTELRIAPSAALRELVGIVGPAPVVGRVPAPRRLR